MKISNKTNLYNLWLEIITRHYDNYVTKSSDYDLKAEMMPTQYINGILWRLFKAVESQNPSFWLMKPNNLIGLAN
jgi:hypothetical protein